MAAPQTIATPTAMHGPPNPRAQRALRKAADEVVGQVFYGTLLRQMRASALKGDYGHGGRGEEMFQAQLDQILAERASGAGRMDLADVLVERFEHRASMVEKHKQRIQQMMQQTQRELAVHERGPVEERRW